MSLAKAVTTIVKDIRRDLNDPAIFFKDSVPAWAHNLISGYINALQAALEAAEPEPPSNPIRYVSREDYAKILRDSAKHEHPLEYISSATEGDRLAGER